MTKPFKYLPYALIAVFFGLLAIFSYVWKFYSLDLSSDPVHWSNFATYLSGTIGLIVSITSLLILGRISIEIHKNSAQENESALIRERKRTAYDKLMEYYIKMRKSDFEAYLDKRASKFNSYNLKLQESSINSLRNHVIIYSEFNIYLQNFHLIYCHIFSIDFKKSTYYDLKSVNEKLLFYFENIYSSELKNVSIDLKEFSDLSESQGKLLDSFIKLLKEDIISK